MTASFRDWEKLPSHGEHSSIRTSAYDADYVVTDLTTSHVRRRSQLGLFSHVV